MVSKEVINDVISKSIQTVIKCASSSRAKKLGATGVVEVKGNTKTITYDDGTVINLSVHDDMDDTVDGVSSGGRVYDYLGKDRVHKYFQYQDDYLKKQKAEVNEFKAFNMRGGVMNHYEWETEYDFVKSMVDSFATSFGMDINRKFIYGGEKLRHYTGESYFGSPIVPMDSDLHVNHLFEIARNNRIDKSDLALVTYTRGFFQENNLDKLSYTKKGYTSTTAGGYDEDLQENFKGTDGWTIITTVKKDSNTRGLFFGNALKESRTRFHDFYDWEAEVNLPPQTRFTRDIIDEKNHIIVQHIVKQKGVEISE